MATNLYRNDSDNAKEVSDTCSVLQSNCGTSLSTEKKKKKRISIVPEKTQVEEALW